MSQSQQRPFLRRLPAMPLGPQCAAEVLAGHRTLIVRPGPVSRYRGPLALHVPTRRAWTIRPGNITGIVQVVDCVPVLPDRDPSPRAVLYSPYGDRAVLTGPHGPVDVTAAMPTNLAYLLGGWAAWIVDSPRPLARRVPCAGTLGTWTLNQRQSVNVELIAQQRHN